MKAFAPYKVTRQTSTELHLAESGGRRWFLFIFFRVFPLVLAALLLGVVYNVEELPGGLKALFIGGFLFIIIMLLTRNYITEAFLSKTGASIKLNTLLGTKERFYVAGDIEKIIVMVRQGGKGGGFFYKLRLKDGGSAPLLTIPSLYVDMRKLPEINRVLTEVTGLEVEAT
jgi:hypothetical protein